MEVFSFKTQILSNNNLLKFIFSYLKCKDLSATSQVCKKWNQISDKHFARYWKEECNEFFCSNNDQNQLTAIQDCFQIHKFKYPSHDHIYTMTDINISQMEFNWKELFALGLKIKIKWNEYNTNSTGIVKKDLENLQDALYSYLKEFLGNPKLRKDNAHLENNINTLFQYSLYDYLNEEEDLYNEYNEVLLGMNENSQVLSNYPFGVLIEHYSYVVNHLQLNVKQLHQFSLLRWYIHDCNYDMNQILNELNGSMTDNVVIFTLKIILMTIKHHCFISFNYLNSSQMNNEEFLNEYSVRYQNYIQTAIEINDQYRHLSIVVNLIYDKFGSKTGPKFSLLRLFMITWNNCCLQKLKGKLNQAVSDVFEKIVEKDFECLINNDKSVINISNYDESMRTTCTSKGTIPATSVCYYNCDFFQDQDFSQNEPQKKLISNVLSQLNDSFCDEYSVFKINLTTIETNDIYDSIEDNISELLRKAITSFYNYKRQGKIQPTIIINELLNYFKNSTFYQSYFINKLQLKLFNTIDLTLESLLASELYSVFENNFQQSDLNTNFSLQVIDVFFEHFDNDYEGVTYNELLKKMHFSTDPKINEYILILFLEKYTKTDGNLFSLSNIVNKWYIAQEGSLIIKNKKVNKEIRTRKIRTEFSQLEKKILSFAWRPCIPDVIAYEEELKQRNIKLNNTQMNID